ATLVTLADHLDCDERRIFAGEGVRQIAQFGIAMEAVERDLGHGMKRTDEDPFRGRILALASYVTSSEWLARRRRYRIFMRYVGRSRSRLRRVALPVEFFVPARCIAPRGTGRAREDAGLYRPCADGRMHARRRRARAPRGARCAPAVHRRQRIHADRR